MHGLATVLTEVGADGVRFSRSYKHRGAPLLSFCLGFLSLSLSLPHILHRMTMNRTLSTVPAMDVCRAGNGCLPGSVPDTWNRLRTRLPVYLPVCLSVLPASELVCHSV